MRKHGATATTSLASLESALRKLPFNRTNPHLPALEREAESALDTFAEKASEVEAQMALVRALSKARGAMGIAGLEKGSPIRTVLERLVNDDELRAGTTLLVDQRVEIRDRHDVHGRVEPYGYTLMVEDPAMNSLWRTAFHEPVRHPTGVSIPKALGQAIETLPSMRIVRLPAVEVHVTGPEREIVLPAAEFHARPLKYLGDVFFDADEYLQP